MTPRFFVVAAVLLAAQPVLGQSNLPTVDQATTISQRTGRPIFAMAGRST